MAVKYQASCHCGAIKLNFSSEEINGALRCTCSICSRKGAMMTPFTVPNEELSVTVDGDNLGLYQFDNKVAKHYFCKTCGIYTHNETVRAPGSCRVNLGCIEDLDTSELEVTVFDGKNLL